MSYYAVRVGRKYAVVTYDAASQRYSVAAKPTTGNVHGGVKYAHSVERLLRSMPPTATYKTLAALREDCPEAVRTREWDIP